MNIYALKEQIKEHEGFSAEPYFCTEGKLTIGYGRNLEAKGISEDEASRLLDNDIEETVKDLISIFDDWYQFSEDRQNALADMRFQLGYGGFRGFKKMIKAVQNKEWGKAAAEAFDSKWRKQGPLRALKVIDMLKGGTE